MKTGTPPDHNQKSMRLSLPSSPSSVSPNAPPLSDSSLLPPVKSSGNIDQPLRGEDRNLSALFEARTVKCAVEKDDHICPQVAHLSLSLYYQGMSDTLATKQHVNDDGPRPYKSNMG